MTLPQLNTIYKGDCTEILENFSEGWADMIFADPPYNLQLANELWRPDNTLVAGVNDSWDKFGSNANYDLFTEKWLIACRRALKDTGTLWVIGTYHNIYRVGKILSDLGFWLLNDVVWVKSNPMPNFRGVRFTNAHETLLWAQKKKGAPYTFNYSLMKAINGGKQMRSDWQLPLCTGSERIMIDGKKAHSTQKPECLLERVILASTKPGDVVLDPFLGTGTTAAVAKKYHRHWVGIDREASYIYCAEKRIESVIPVPENHCWLNYTSKRDEVKVPFKELIGAGLLSVGQPLYSRHENWTAFIEQDGEISSGELKGSIHRVASLLRKSNTNGWEFWLYKDTEGKLRSIDDLRKNIRDKKARPG